MPIAISATVLTADSPAPVQVSVTGLSADDEYVVLGTYDGFSWPIPGGVGTSDGSTLVLVDNRCPLNCDVAYTVTVDEVTYTATTVQVTSSAYCILQNITGTLTVECEVTTDRDPRSRRGRVSVFEVARRTDMPGRYDRGLAPSMTLGVEVATIADNLTLEQIIDAGGPIVRRNDGVVTTRGIRPTEILAVFGEDDALVGAVGTRRVWALQAQQVGDPEPGVVLVAFDLDDVKTAFSGDTLADFKTFFSGQDLDYVRQYDWGLLL